MEEIKCVAVGDVQVGKTCLLITYTSNQFPTQLPAVWDDYVVTRIIDGKSYNLRLVDTVGREEYDRLRPLVYTHVNVFLLCFSVASPSSFENIKCKWIKEVRERCPYTPILLVGTQIDLRNDSKTIKSLAKKQQKPIMKKQGEQLAKELNAVKYVECSAIVKKGVKNVFDEVTLTAIRSRTERNSCVII